MFSASWKMRNPMAKGLLAAILSAGLSSIALAGHVAAEHDWAGDGGAPPDVAAANQPDVPGGYASTHIVIQVQPETRPRALADGRWTVDAADPLARTPEVVMESVLLAAALDDWFVIDISRGIEPANQQRAAEIGLDRYYKVRVPQGTDTPAMAEDIRRFDSLIERAEVDGIGGITGQVIPNDELFPEQWALHNTGQTGGTAGADISATFAWDIYNDADDESIVLAVLDTGVTEHEDLEGRLVSGWNTHEDSSDTDDVHGHGTHVAGTAAANTDNGIGIAGVSWGARIMPVKVLSDGGSGTESQAADGVIFATDNGAHVINMSLGYNTGTDFFHSAVQYAHEEGVLVVTSAGNSGAAGPRYPALWPETLAVGATDHNDNLASFSSIGPEVNVSAPGVSILSTVPSGYGLASGTSMSSPHVAGLACLMLSFDPDLTNEEVWQILEATADSRGTPGHNVEYGYGRINAATALQFLDGAIHVPDDHSSIQHAINAAADGDLIVVAPGTYNEAIDFGDKSIHLRSWNQPHATIIDASGLGKSAVTIAGGQGSDAVLHGFTITGGSGTDIDGTTFGGGVYVAGSSPSITGNRFIDNYADEGGGIFADDFSSPAVGASFFCVNEPDHIAGPWTDLGGIEFCLSIPTVADLIALSVEVGSVVSGTLDDLRQSNNQYLIIESQHGQGRQRTTTIIDAHTDAETIDQLDLTIETGVEDANATVTTHVELWNFDAGSWDEIDSFSQPESDTVSAYTHLDTAQYISGSGDMSVRLRTVANLNPNNPYVFRIDHVEFVTHEPIEPGPIQQMIDDAEDGDVVTIEPGVHSEPIDLQGKAITLQSAEGPENTILDVTGFPTSAITAISGEGPDTIIKGFTITGGSGFEVDGEHRGGGMYIENSSPTIENCVFIGNTADVGGGIATVDGSPTIENCTFENNTATAATGGGGIYALGGSPTITDCLFHDNEAPRGGGIRNIESSPVVTNAEFTANTANMFGGAVYNGPESNAAFVECHFEDNASNNSGGATFNFTESELVYDNCTFVNNTSSWAGALMSQAADIQITNCSFESNTATFASGGAVHSVQGSAITITNASFENNSAETAGGAFSNRLDSSMSMGDSFFCENAPNHSAGSWSDLGGNDSCDDGLPLLSIQHLIDEADDGAEIILEPGLYTEPVNFEGKNITLRSADPGDPAIVADTVIDVTEFSTSAVTMTSGEGSGAVLEGFTITGGVGTIETDLVGDPRLGGGAYIRDSNPTIRRCVFISNTAALGGGIFNYEASPTIEDCVFEENTATDEPGGGGMYNLWDSNATIAGSTFVENDAAIGGGIRNQDSHPLIDGCNFVANTANFGAGMFSGQGSEPQVIASVFKENFAEVAGGGSYDFDGAGTTYEDCTFADNWAESNGAGLQIEDSNVQLIGCQFEGNETPGNGAALFNGWSSTVTLTECTFALNTAGDSGAGLYNYSDSEATVTFSVFEANSAGSEGGGIISVNGSSASVGDTLLCENEPDHIAGDWNDLGGNLLLDECEDPPEPIVVEDGDSISDAIAMAEAGDIILVEAGTYIEAIDFAGLDIHIRSADGPEVTVIDASGLGTSAVTFASGEGPDAILEGFTVTGGEGTLLGEDTVGGGVFINASSPTITDIIVEGNTADYGAGIFTMNEASPTVSECLFVSNIAIVAGGGMYNEASDPLIEFCDFEANSADYGGGMFNHASDPEIVASVFFANTAIDGGAMYNEASDPLIESCDIVENVAEESGGGIFSDENSLPALADSFVCENEPGQIEGPWDDLGGNTICPDDPGEPFVAPLLDYEVEIGEQLNDDFELNWFTAQDQQYLFIESDRVQGRHRTNTIVDVDAGTAPLVQLDVHTVSGLDADPPATVTTAVELWNFDTGEWDEIDSFEQSSAGDQSSSTFDVATPNAYVAGDGTISVRVRSEAPGNPHQPPYVYRIDQVEVVVTPEAE